MRILSTKIRPISTRSNLLRAAPDPERTGGTAAQSDGAARAPQRQRRAVGAALRNQIATEAQEQAAVIQWARLMQRQYPELELLFAVPNGDLRDIRTAAKLKRQGVRRGVPDLILPVPRGPHNGLGIEMKRRRYAHTSADQKRFLKLLNEAGWLAIVCAGAGQAIGALLEYLEIGDGS